jgi:DnaJ-class molecular chaperone
MENTKKCPHCEGRGELYDGWPDAVGTPTEECNACNGTGRITVKVEEQSSTFFLKAA